MPQRLDRPARATWWAVTIVLMVAATVVLALAAGRADLVDQTSPESGVETTANNSLPASSPGVSGTNAPTAPVAEVCGSGALRGPSDPPANAVKVSTDQNLADVVRGRAEETTYWLSAGTHHLGKGIYDQIVPHRGDTFLGAPGPILDGHRINRYAFGGDASDVTIKFLTVQNFGSARDNNNEGVVNHDLSEGWTVDSSTIQKNAGAGVMLGSRNRLTRSCLRDNGQYGFSAYHEDGVTDVLLDGNEISGNNTDDWETRQPGCGCTGGGKFWATNGAKITGNYVHDNRGVGLWADSNNVGFRFEGNYISENDAEGIMYETSYNAVIVDNAFVRNAHVKGPTNPKFPASAIYISESGSDERVDGPYSKAFRVTGNVFTDNWSGIVAWENADRFAGSPANTSTGVGTLVNPSVATVSACASKSKIKKAPFYDDCRWKTQNVLVEANTFATDPAKIEGCKPSAGCGFNGLFSNYGTYPRWSPYKGEVVQKDITFEQNNTWRNNTYTGSWQFVVEEAGNVVAWDEWRSPPYGQDAESSMT